MSEATNRANLRAILVLGVQTSEHHLWSVKNNNREDEKTVTVDGGK